MNISEVTRRDITDAIQAEGIAWSGRLDDVAFLSRVFDLQVMRSTDPRYRTAADDIWKHRIMNNDWEDDWVFYDDRFDLMHCEEDVFLQFLCETVHPIVRPDASESVRIVQLYNGILASDGYELVEKTRLSGRPIYVGRPVLSRVTPGLNAAREALTPLDPTYLAQQITRMEAAVESDPDLAIGTSKELVETCCQTILVDRGKTVPKGIDLPALVKLTTKELRLTPTGIPEEARAADTVRRLLSNLATVAQGIAELRNVYGTGHGRSAKRRGLETRHAKLMVGCASTLAVFLYETHVARQAQDGRK